MKAPSFERELGVSLKRERRLHFYVRDDFHCDLRIPRGSGKIDQVKTSGEVSRSRAIIALCGIV